MWNHQQLSLADHVTHEIPPKALDFTGFNRDLPKKRTPGGKRALHLDCSSKGCWKKTVAFPVGNIGIGKSSLVRKGNRNKGGNLNPNLDQ